jgi:hypothetical protein
MKKVLLNGVIVVVIGLGLSEFIPALDTTVIEDGDLTVGDLITLVGEAAVLIGTGVIRFIVGRDEKEAKGVR